MNTHKQISSIVKCAMFCVALVVPIVAGGLEHVRTQGHPQGCSSADYERAEYWGGGPYIPSHMNALPSPAFEVVHASSAPNPFIPGFPSPNLCGAPSLPAGIINAAAAFNSASLPGLAPFIPANRQFTFAPAPMRAFGQDDVNILTFHEGPLIFGGAGGQATLAVTSAYLDFNAYVPEPTRIYEADIAFNASSITGYSFVDADPLIPANYNFSLQAPVLGFADLQGVLMHEMGHVLGLGHSVIDGQSAANNSHFPTMFPVAQVLPFPAQVGITRDQFCQAQTYQLDGAATLDGGILGISARTLERDDLSAIGELWQPTNYLVSYGAIEGTVREWVPTWGMNLPINGVVVVAVKADNPAEAIRVQTLTYSYPHNAPCDQFANPVLGRYQIRGLTPGSYYVYVQSVDQDSRGTTCNPGGVGPPCYAGYYSKPSDPPNWVDRLQLGQGSMLTNTAGPFPLPTPYPTEYYSGLGESSLEGSQFFATHAQAGVAITVDAGTTTSGIDFVLEYNSTTAPTLDMLTVQAGTAGGPGYASPRGLAIYPHLGSQVSVGFTVRGLKANQQCTLLSGTARTLTLIDGQLREVANALSTTSADATGTAVFQLMLPYGNLENTFYQVGYRYNGKNMFTNVVNVWSSTQ